MDVKFEPINPGVELWNPSIITKCRDIVCTDSTDLANTIAIRAIEPGGFYTLAANYTITLENINKVTTPVKLTVLVDNGSTEQHIEIPYVVRFGMLDPD